MAKRRVRLAVAPFHELFLILTVKGLDFVDEWYKSKEHIPSNLTRLYQLLLRTARLNGVIGMWIAIRLGYGREVINNAISNACLVLSRRPRKPTGEVLRRIEKMYGKPPEEIYA